MIVYKATSKINGKIYIGATRKTMEYRKHQHERDAIKRIKKYPFLNALFEHGFDNWIWEELYYTDNDDDLFINEAILIKKYNSTDREIGYNVSSGGKNAVLDGKKNGMYGKTHTDIARKIYSDRLKGKTYVDLYGEEKANEIKQKQISKRLGSKRSAESIMNLSKYSGRYIDVSNIINDMIFDYESGITSLELSKKYNLSIFKIRSELMMHGYNVKYLDKIYEHKKNK